MKVIDPPAPAVVVQPQPAQADLVVPVEVPVDHSTGVAIKVITEGGAGESQIPDTMPQPDPIGVEDCHGVTE